MFRLSIIVSEIHFRLLSSLTLEEDLSKFQTYFSVGIIKVAWDVTGMWRKVKIRLREVSRRLVIRQK